LEHCFIWLRDLDTKNTGADASGELSNVVLEENHVARIRKRRTSKFFIAKPTRKRSL
jgi:hypothetical protein